MSDEHEPGPPPDDPEGVRIIGADEAAEVLGRDDVAHRRGPDEPRPGDRPTPPPDDVPEPRLRFPLSSSADETGSAELPHWTEPPTGQHGAVGGTIFDREPAEEEDWSSFAASPRWSDEQHDQDRGLGAADADVGALDDDRPDPEEFFTFDDLDEPVGRSVFDEPPDDVYYDDDIDLGDHDEPAEYDEEPRKIVVGGGRVTPGPQVPPIPGAAGGAGVGGDRDIGQAAVVGVVFLGVAIGLFVLGPAPAAFLVTCVVTFAAAELLTKLREVGYRPASLLGVVATAGMVIGTYHRGETAIPIALVLTVAFGLLWYLAGAGEGQATLNLGVTLLVVGWVGMFGSFATALLAIQGGPGVGDAGKGILFGAILATVGYDVGGYFVGRSAGRSPLSEASPNKTIEGLLGGCVAAVTIAVIYGFLSEPLGSLGDGLTLGVAVAVAAPLGDLCQSMIKRDLGIKDMGTVLPGHGGFMDRFDGLLFVLPAVYYAARLSDFFL